jgi:hypothetical protein
MVWADHMEGKDQVKMLRKICIGLGFKSENVKYITDKALKLVHQNIDLDTFTEEMRTMNQ